MRKCKYKPNIICEYKRCTPSCSIYREQLRKTIKYPIPICVYEDQCKYKGQMKKLKLPICKWYETETGTLLTCQYQLFISKTWLEKHKPNIKKLRLLWWKYKKAGVI